MLWVCSPGPLGDTSWRRSPRGPGAFKHLKAQPLWVPKPLNKKGCPGSEVLKGFHDEPLLPGPTDRSLGELRPPRQ